MPSETALAGAALYADAQAVLTAYAPVLRAIATAGGPNCEAVLHNLEGADVDLGHTIMAIANGHVTGREVGGPSTSIGLAVQQNPDADHDAFGYRGFTSDGRELRCSSIYFRNPAGRIIAALCINVDLSAMQQARAVLDSLLPTTDPGAIAPDEYIGGDLVSVMDAMITRAIHETGKPVGQLTRDDRIAVLQTLDRQGATQMRKSIEAIATRLGISRVTAYAYLDEARSRD
ncbi:helix-turn-helix transcriptional regulator [Enemella dayhoffiae]|uniref:helix-turn-helix transcriptional regulator n=1 Tax=Enemella dayhoffiae TaxID=2016507 RepID=UPI001595B8C5|nr:helix-turn-helix transcriptional regulator [Enemella dayhoffiae]